MATLESWLKDNKLSKILGALNDNDVEDLEELQELETEQDVEDFVGELTLKTIQKKKFKKALLALNNIGQPGAPQQSSKQADKPVANKQNAPKVTRGEADMSDDAKEQPQSQQAPYAGAPTVATPAQPTIQPMQAMNNMNNMNNMNPMGMNNPMMTPNMMQQNMQNMQQMNQMMQQMQQLNQMKQMGMDANMINMMQQNLMTQMMGNQQTMNTPMMMPNMMPNTMPNMMQQGGMAGAAAMGGMAQNNAQKPMTPAVQQSPVNDDIKETKEPEEPEVPTKPTRKVYNLKGIHAVDKLDDLDPGKPHRTIMVIGATGTGKTTLLNSMMNYLYQVEYDDPYRFKLVYEIQKDDGQAESQTDVVTAYHLDPPALDYQVTVVDTPGFGDTRGIEHDEKITKNIKRFFKEEIQEIDAVCFVIRAPQARLTPTQKYIFASVLGIFGNDIANNILVLMTFADGKKPPALAALKAGDVPFGKHFKLNNSAFDLPEDDEEEDMFATMFWKMGMKSFEDLFKAINLLKTKSLQLTNKVLTRREELETYITNVQPTIRAGFTTLERLRTQIEVIKKFGVLMNTNKDFTYEVTVPKATEVPNGGGCTTTCIACNYTCHKHCGIPDDGDKRGCAAMRNGNCTVCPDKCYWSKHKNLPYTVEWHDVKETRTSQGLKDKYVDAQSNKSAEEQIMAGTVTELAETEMKLNGLISSVKDCLNELTKIALRPNVLSQDDYIDKLIQSEQSERKDGWQKRVNMLQGLKEKQDMLSQLNDDNYNPWAQYEDVAEFVASNTTITAKIKSKKPKGGKRNNKKQKKSGMWSAFTSWF